MTLDTSRIVKLLAAQFDFDADEGMRLVDSATSRTDRTDRADRADFLTALAVAESNDEARSKSKTATPKLTAAAKKEASAAKKAEREAKKAAKEAKPKRAPTGYLLFARICVLKLRLPWKISWKMARSWLLPTRSRSWLRSGRACRRKSVLSGTRRLPTTRTLSRTALQAKLRPLAMKLTKSLCLRHLRHLRHRKSSNCLCLCLNSQPRANPRPRSQPKTRG